MSTVAALHRQFITRWSMFSTSTSMNKEGASNDAERCVGCGPTCEGKRTMKFLRRRLHPYAAVHMTGSLRLTLRGAVLAVVVIMNRKRPALAAGVLAAVAAIATSSAAAGTGTPTVQPQTVDDAQVQVTSTTVGGADVLPTTRTVQHWWGSTLNPHNGVTYGYNMVGANPNNCSGSTCSVTLEVDITPVIVNIDGMTFSGSDVLAAAVASPEFVLNDYGSTPYATGFSSPVVAPRGPGGVLSQDDAGIPLQLQDATMRAQFNKTGLSNYHLILHPNVLQAVMIAVPNNQGLLVESGQGNVYAAVDLQWWQSHIHNLVTKADPSHLALYLTDDIRLYVGDTKSRFCCYDGYHGADSATSNGNAAVQTYAWASWFSPGVQSRPNGGRLWAVQDMFTLSHEVAEWASDPFVTNTVEPWGFPYLPGVFCSSFLETGDPVSIMGFAMGTNAFRQGPNANGTQSADGYYHPEDEATLPWFMRLAPNTVSEPTQTPSPNIGRYTFMGHLEGFAGFNVPSEGC
jgi:hypothetical protein